MLDTKIVRRISVAVALSALFSQSHASSRTKESEDTPKPTKAQISFTINDAYFGQNTAYDSKNALPQKEEASHQALQAKKDSGLFEYYSRGLTNILQTAWGEQMSPSRLLGEIKSKICTGWKQSETKYNQGNVKESMYFSRKKDDGSEFVVTAPAHDLGDDAHPVEKIQSGNLSVKDVLAQILKDKPKGNIEVCIPVAQANRYFFGLAKRNHWTTLRVTIKDGKIITSDLYDSKGWLSSLYGGTSYIQHQLAKSETTQISGDQITGHYLGHQGLINNKDCGRFSAAYIDGMNKGQNPTEMTTSQAKGGLFSSLWRKDSRK